MWGAVEAEAVRVVGRTCRMVVGADAERSVQLGSERSPAHTVHCAYMSSEYGRSAEVRCAAWAARKAFARRTRGVPLTTSTCHDWVLELDGAAPASEKITRIVSVGTASGRNARVA